MLLHHTPSTQQVSAQSMATSSTAVRHLFREIKETKTEHPDRTEVIDRITKNFHRDKIEHFNETEVVERITKKVHCDGTTVITKHIMEYVVNVNEVCGITHAAAGLATAAAADDNITIQDGGSIARDDAAATAAACSAEVSTGNITSRVGRMKGNASGIVNATATDQSITEMKSDKRSENGSANFDIRLDIDHDDDEKETADACLTAATDHNLANTSFGMHSSGDSEDEGTINNCGIAATAEAVPVAGTNGSELNLPPPSLKRKREDSDRATVTVTSERSVNSKPTVAMMNYDSSVGSTENMTRSLNEQFQSDNTLTSANEVTENVLLSSTSQVFCSATAQNDLQSRLPQCVNADTNKQLQLISPPVRRSSRKKYKVVEGLAFDDMMHNWQRHKENMKLGHITQCTQQLQNTSEKDLQELRKFRKSFVANALSAMTSVPLSSKRIREQQLNEYMRVAIAKKLNLNDWSYGDNAVGWAIRSNCLDSLEVLLNQGYSLLQGRFNAVWTAINVSNHAALELIFSKREEDAKKLIKVEVQSYFSSYCKAVENRDTASFQLLLDYGCATMSNRDAWWIFESNIKGKLSKNLSILWRQTHPNNPDIMQWTWKMRWSFPPIMRGTLEWLLRVDLRMVICEWYKAKEKEQNKATDDEQNRATYEDNRVMLNGGTNESPDEVWCHIFSFLGRDAIPTRR